MDEKYARYLLGMSKGGYDLIAERFSDTRCFLGKDLGGLLEYVNSGDRVLDLGCGNGRLFGAIKEKGGDYHGIDNSEKLIELAKKNNPQAEFQTADALNIPFGDNYFDKVFAIAVLHHIPSLKLRLDFLKEIKRVLKQNGVLILTVWKLSPKKQVWRVLLENAFLKIIGKSKLDFKDIFYPWKDFQGKVLTQRYVHLFSSKELNDLAKRAGFTIKDFGETERGKDKDTNLFLIASK